MAVYRFNLYECGTVVPDHEGQECSGEEAVRVAALKAARDVMCAEVSEGRLCLGCCIDVTDDTGALFLRLPFREAVTITGY